MRILIVVLLSFLWSNVQSQVGDCVLKKDADKILVYTCKSESERFKSLKATFTISNTTIEELLAFMKQVNRYTAWQYNICSAKILKRVSNRVIIVRTEIDAPRPVDNRELIVEYFFSQSPDKKLKVIAKTVAFDYPFNNDVIRVPFSYAEWNVEMISNTLHVTHLMKIDPGGSVPAWIVNVAMADGPHQS
ncbi:MAG TPA: hypothetical protein PLJ60_12950 [Chryseolinea sp.]|nr:hypothetical protein [Chryseolinea sp.]HPM31235.1 hypothetical protein [Chryseolinea sp.]